MEFLAVKFWKNMGFLNVTFWNNTVKEWLTALIMAIIVLIILRLVKWILVRYFANRAQQYRWDVFELTATVARRTQLPFVMIFAIYVGLQVLDLPQRLQPWIFGITMGALICQLTLWANSLLDYYLVRSQQRSLKENAARVTTLRAAGFIAKLVLATIAAILILDNIPGVEITALVASLGITGIAVALAVQNILSDLFASLSIVLDKPFVIGDFALNFEVVYYMCWTRITIVTWTSSRPLIWQYFSHSRRKGLISPIRRRRSTSAA